MSSRMVGQRTRGDEYNEIERRKIELEEQLLDLQERRLDIEQKRIELELRKLKLVKGKSKRKSKRSSSQAPREESGDENEARDPRRLVSSVDSDDEEDYDDGHRSRSSSRRGRSYDNVSTDGMTTDDDSCDDDEGIDEDDLMQDVPKSKRLSRGPSSTSDTGEPTTTNLPPSGRGGKPLKRSPSVRDVAEASVLPPLPAKGKSVKRGNVSPPTTPKDSADPGNAFATARKNGIPLSEPPRRRRSGRRGSAPAPGYGGEEADIRVLMQRHNSARGDDLTGSNSMQDSERSLGSEDTEKRSNTRYM